MSKYKILTLNKIFPGAYKLLPSNLYTFGKFPAKKADAIILRSQDLHGMEINPSLKAVVRAGSGVNNIPIKELALAGIPVFNTPGANTNSVKELVLAGMLMATRNINEALAFVDTTLYTSDTDREVSAAVELHKVVYKGRDLAGRTIGIVGLGNIGSSLANLCVELGMHVIGYDQYLTVDQAWNISPHVQSAHSMEDLYSRAKDFVTVHVPLTTETKDMINTDALAQMNDGVTVLNFARGGIVNEDDIAEALKTGKVHTYVCDFPSIKFRDFSARRVIALPHLGASTENAEENCGAMAMAQLRAYLEHGNITNSVNFPTVDSSRPHCISYRIAIIHKNLPNMLAQISAKIGEMNINILNMTNKSKEEIAYTLIDTEDPFSPGEVDQISSIDGVLSARFLE
jgi:D-3-phosphoglycerate dehydrogenase